MKNNFITKIIGATLAFAMMIGGAVGINAAKEAKEVNADNFSTVYNYANGPEGTSVWSLTQYNDQSNYYQVPSGSTPSVATFPDIFDSKAITSDVVITINNATYGSGGSPTASTFSIYNSSDCTSQVTATQSGTLASSSSYVNTIYTVSKNDAVSSFSSDLAIKIVKPGRTIRLKSVTIAFTYSSLFGTLDHIKVDTLPTKTVFDVGDTFSSEGLVLIGYDGADEATAASQTYSSGYVTSLSEDYTFVAGDVGEKTITVTYNGKTTTYTIEVLPSPDYILDGSDNKPESLTSSTNSDVASSESSGIEYKYYALQTYNTNLEFNKNVEGAYIGNSETYGKYIKSVRVTLPYDNFNRLAMYKGDSVIPETSVVSTSDGGLQRIYDFNDDSEFFALKQTETSNYYIQISKIEIYLGTTIAVESVSATVADRTYYAGATLSASDFNVTVDWSGNRANTNPTNGFTWTVNGIENGALASGDNNVVVTFGGQSSSVIIVSAVEATAREKIESLKTQTSLSYRYSTDEVTITDTLTKSFTTVTGSSYTSWSDKTGTSGAVYAGKTSGGNTNVDYIQMKNGDSTGIVTTASSRNAKKVTVTWNEGTTTGRTIDIYGKNTAYSSASDLYGNASVQGTKLGSIVYGTSTSVTIVGDYTYIGIRSKDGALYLDNIEIDWFDSLSYDYSNISIRFGANITKALWDELDTNDHVISGFGVIIADGDFVTNAADMAAAMSDVVSSTVTTTFTQEVYVIDYFVPIANKASTIGEDANNYFWNLRWDIDEANMDKTYSAVAYIKVGDEYVLMNMARESVETLALDYLTNRGCNENTAGGSLQAIVDNAQ